jgi:quercetin dioxygenase-like cupin family protein
MVEVTLHRRGTALVRRLTLAPGEATKWHTDPFHRVSVIFKGQALAIEFRDGCASLRVRVTPGQVDWDEPSDRIHRAVNIADVPYEEVTVFFLAHPDDIAQPDAPPDVDAPKTNPCLPSTAGGTTMATSGKVLI